MAQTFSDRGLDKTPSSLSLWPLSRVSHKAFKEYRAGGGGEQGQDDWGLEGLPGAKVGATDPFHSFILTELKDGTEMF